MQQDEVSVTLHPPLDPLLFGRNCESSIGSSSLECVDYWWTVRVHVTTWLQHGSQQRAFIRVWDLPLCQSSFRSADPLYLHCFHCSHYTSVSTGYKLVFLASVLHDTGFLLLHDRSHTPLLPPWLPHQKVSTQDQKPRSLGPAVPLCVLWSPGSGSHLLQQTPEWQITLHLMAWSAGPDHSVCSWAAVFGSCAPHLPFSGQRLVAGQTQTLPRSIWTCHLPAWQHQPAPWPLLYLVHCFCRRIHLVPGSTLPCSQHPRHNEPNHKCLHG